MPRRPKLRAKESRCSHLLWEGRRLERTALSEHDRHVGNIIRHTMKVRAASLRARNLKPRTLGHS